MYRFKMKSIECNLFSCHVDILFQVFITFWDILPEIYIIHSQIAHTVVECGLDTLEG